MTKLVYVATHPLAGITFPLMGGGMGNSDLDAKLQTMAMPEELDAAIDECRQSIVKEIRKAVKQGRELKSVEYFCEVVNEHGIAGVLVEGAYMQVTANVVYK